MAREKVTEPVIGNFKGNPTLTLPVGSGRGWTFGKAKAKAIIEKKLEIIELATSDDDDKVISIVIYPGHPSETTLDVDFTRARAVKRYLPFIEGFINQ